MVNLTRTEVARLIQSKLLNGKRFTPKQFDELLRKHGDHERSRVLELLRNQWGIPITRDLKGAYYVSESDLRYFYIDPDDVFDEWKAKAKENRDCRKMFRFLKTLLGLAGISPETRTEVLAAVKARSREACMASKRLMKEVVRSRGVQLRKQAKDCDDEKKRAVSEVSPFSIYGLSREESRKLNVFLLSLVAVKPPFATAFSMHLSGSTVIPSHYQQKLLTSLWLSSSLFWFCVIACISELFCIVQPCSSLASPTGGTCHAYHSP